MRIAATTVVIVLAALVGCSENTTQRAPGSAPEATPADARPAPDATAEPTPGGAGDVTLWVEGFGCPMCATNLEFELEEIAGVIDATIDLQRGTASVLLAKGATPTEADYRKAAADSGLTLSRLEGVGITR